MSTEELELRRTFVREVEQRRKADRIRRTIWAMVVGTTVLTLVVVMNFV